MNFLQDFARKFKVDDNELIVGFPALNDPARVARSSWVGRGNTAENNLNSDFIRRQPSLPEALIRADQQSPQQRLLDDAPQPATPLQENNSLPPPALVTRSVSPSQPKPIRRPRHSVAFSSESSMIQFEKDPSVKDAIWYNKSQLRQLKVDAAREAQLLRRRYSSGEFESLDDNEFCDMGIEHVISIDLAKEKIKRIKKFKQAVLAEQQRQESMDTCDPDQLAQVSCTHSQWSRKFARKCAKRHSDSSS